MKDSNQTRRGSWSDLPAAVRAEVEGAVGGSIAGFKDSAGGFSVDAVVGIGSTLELQRFFIKAVSDAHSSASDYRLEARLLQALPLELPTPRLLAFVRTEGWVALVLEALDGHTPDEPWAPSDLGGALDMLTSVRPLLSNVHIELPTVADRMFGRCDTFRRATQSSSVPINDWALARLDRLREHEELWPELVVGNTLLHFDLRHDNWWIDEDGSVKILDWGRACRGPAWVDVVCLLLLSDIGNVDPGSLFADHVAATDVSAHALDSFLVALLSYWTTAAQLPPAIGATRLRRRQERSRAATERWLDQRW